jgi:hypothetical protein
MSEIRRFDVLVSAVRPELNLPHGAVPVKVGRHRHPNADSSRTMAEQH